MLLKLFTILFVAALAAGAYYMPKNPEISAAAVGIPETPVHSEPNPEELGAVRWLRDYDTGVAESGRTGKPILILFQEVPGCSNCTRYGKQTLSHPLIVEAIETSFVPVCIYNNQKGKDAEVLAKFDEPAWNNPVVRIVNAEGKDVVLRISNFNSTLELVSGMRRALDLSGVQTPKYLELLEEELSAREAGAETATFSMHCFWTGEAAFGKIPGVIETEAGFQDGREVVRVTYNPHRVGKSDLEKITQPKGFTSCSKNEGFKTDREPKYYLAQTDYRFIPMTPLQAARANSLVGEGLSPDALLSPRQLAAVKKIASEGKKSGKNMIGRKDLAKAWEEL